MSDLITSYPCPDHAHMWPTGRLRYSLFTNLEGFGNRKFGPRELLLPEKR